MQPKALFIGSIGVVSETSEFQRQAYNKALRESGLGWEWSPEVYPKLLRTSGGMQRLETLAAATNQSVGRETVTKIHRRKTELAGREIVAQRVPLRPGVAELIRAARAAGAKVAWVTSTSPANTNALLEAAGDALSADDFDRIFHRDDAAQGKPSPDVYHAALEYFGLAAEDCLAVEDSVDSVLAAKGAGVYVIATLGANHAGAPVNNIADEVYDSAADIPVGKYF